MPRAFRSVTIVSRCGSERPSRSSFHDQCVARVQIVEAGFQAWSVVARAGCLVGMEMPMIDPGCDERVPLEIDRLAVIGR
jgi:hypothetical protein